MPGHLIRAATQRDATDLTAMIDMAGDGFPTYFWGHMAMPGQSAFDVGRARTMLEDTALSYRNAHIAEVDGVAAGGLVSYAIGKTIKLDDSHAFSEIIRPLVRLESRIIGYWYVNVLAVYPEFRGQGIGQNLLDHAGTLGRAAGTIGIALIVASENFGAVRLYEQSGYREMARETLVAYPGFKRGGEWVLLTKPHY